MDLPQKEYFTVSEVSAIVGVHPNTVRSAIHAGKLPGYRFGKNGIWKIKRTDLENYLQEYREE